MFAENKLILKKKDVLISDEKALATLMNKNFVNITADLDLKRDTETLLIPRPVSVVHSKDSLSSSIFRKFCLIG